MFLFVLSKLAALTGCGFYSGYFISDCCSDGDSYVCSYICVFICVTPPDQNKNDRELKFRPHTPLGHM